MDKEVVIRVEHINKTFKLPHEKQTSIKGALINLSKGGKRSFERQQVLNDVSFEVRKGEFFGIVGRNGSGKSTLLKMLAGIYAPTSGVIHVNGKLTPFIELGVGFSPELTGRENVFLNGALLGFSRSEMSAMYDDIVAFAELEKFMDQKLKNYSSGMQVRLAFSIAIRADTEILLIDEVLAVGDANFQEKCIRVFKDLKKAGRTIVFISHDMGAVKRFCDRAIMIHDGKKVDEGSPEEVASNYEAVNLPSAQSVGAINKQIDKRKSKIITGLNLINEKGQTGEIIRYGEKVSLSVSLNSIDRAQNLGIAIYTLEDAYVFGVNTILDKFKIRNAVNYSFDANLGAGHYYMKIGVFGKADTEVLEFIDKGPVFQVAGSEQNWEGIVKLKHSWS